MDTALLGLRVALSLACVLGLIWFAGRRLQGSSAVRKQRAVPLSVLGRQSLGKGAGIALVEVAGRVLLLGVGEQGVRVLTEVDVPQVPDEPARRGTQTGALSGSERVTEVREEIDLAVVAAADRDVLVAVPGDGRDGLVDLDQLVGPVGAGGVGLPRAHADGAARTATPAGLAAARSASPVGALHGSALSPDTWRRAVDVVQRRTARR